MKIGIYGGSFDPIHIGHINLALEMIEKHDLDEVWFCPASHNPHKSIYTVANSNQRLHMLHLAIENIPAFKILDYELYRDSPSYTIDTLNQLLNEQKDCQTSNTFYLIIGADAVENFHLWHHAEEIVQKVTLLVGQRGTAAKLNLIKGTPPILQAIKKGLTPTRILEISSSEIRQRIADHLCCEHLLNAKVLDYIISHRLYLTFK